MEERSGKNVVRKIHDFFFIQVIHIMPDKRNVDTSVKKLIPHRAYFFDVINLRKRKKRNNNKNRVASAIIRGRNYYKIYAKCKKRI